MHRIPFQRKKDTEGAAADHRWRVGQPHRFTVAEYHRMADASILREGSRVELIGGLIVDKAAITPPHAGMVNRLSELLLPGVSCRAVLSVQHPVQLGEHSELEPDIALLKYRADYYRSAIPRADDVLVAVEVADTMLQEERDMKVPLYAASGIPECWLVDLIDRTVEIYREPVEGRYGRPRIVGSKGNLDVVATLGLTVLLADLWRPWEQDP